MHILNDWLEEANAAILSQGSGSSGSATQFEGGNEAKEVAEKTKASLANVGPKTTNTVSAPKQETQA